jgi:hypothetical protein
VTRAQQAAYFRLLEQLKDHVRTHHAPEPKERRGADWAVRRPTRMQLVRSRNGRKTGTQARRRPRMRHSWLPKD